MLGIAAGVVIRVKAQRSTCAGFGCGSIKGGVLSLRVVDSSNGAVRRVQEWDGLATLSLAGGGGPSIK